MTTSPPAAAPPPTAPADHRTLPGAAAGPTAAPEGPDRGSGTGTGGGRATPIARRLGFAGPVLAALALNTWRLSANGLGNTYYAAAVRSMGQSRHNFFFGAFDPGGFITVDKPPLALWFQTASTKLFGFSSWSLLMPGALAGAASVALLWVIVSRRYGTMAGTVAASALALSPVNVAVDRMNLPDPFMIFFLLASAWAVLRSFDAERWGRWLVLAGLFFGAAFDAKMLAAAIPAPALGLAVLLGSRGSGPHRFKRAAVLAVAALAFTLPWMTIVDLTPASTRPYVGGSSNNTERNLIIGYNGVGRVDGQGESRGARGGARDRCRRRRRSGDPGARRRGCRGGRPVPRRRRLPRRRPRAGGRRPLRRRRRLRRVLRRPAGHVPAVLSFGRAGDRLAVPVRDPGAAGRVVAPPPVAGGAGRHRSVDGLGRPPLRRLQLCQGDLPQLLHQRAWPPGWRRWWASAPPRCWPRPAGIGPGCAYAGGGVVGSAWLAVRLSHRAGPLLGWARPAVVVLTVVTVIGLAAVAAARRGRRYVAAPLAAGLVVVLLTPGAWAVSETTNRSLDAAPAQGGFGRGGFGRGATDDRSGSGDRAGAEASDPAAGEAGLAKFLAAHDTGQRWDLAVTSAMSAADLVATDNLSVMALGGFSGSDPAATVASVATMVQKGEVRYFLTGNGFGRGGGSRRGGPAGGFGGFGGFGRGGTAGQIMQAVQAVCTPVSAAATDGKAPLPSAYAGQLYDCAGQGPALAAHHS